MHWMAFEMINERTGFYIYKFISPKYQEKSKSQLYNLMPICLFCLGSGITLGEITYFPSHPQKSHIQNSLRKDVFIGITTSNPVKN